MGRPLALGALLAIGTGVVWAVLSAVFSLHLGLLVVGAFAGWLIGTVMKPVGQRAPGFAVGLAVIAWLIGSVLDFVLSQAFLPNSATPLVQRLTFSGYLDFLSGTFDIVRLLAIAILVIVAWRSAR